jgi:hypothetical protein
LPEVSEAFGYLRFGFGAVEDGQKHCRKNPDDRDHHQQLD